MRSIKHQHGMTAIGWLLVLVMIGFFVLLGLRMVPAYLDYYKVVSTMDALEEESGFSNPGEIRRLLERRFDVSYVDAITPQEVEIKSKGNIYIVTAAYEKSEHIMGNVYVVMDFEKTIEVKRY